MPQKDDPLSDIGDDDDLGEIRNLINAHRDRSYSRIEIERIVDDRADRKIKDALRNMGFDPDKPAETAALVTSVKNLRRGVTTFIVGIIGAAAVSAWAYFQAHLSGGKP